MKYLFIALLYFCSGFFFPAVSPLLAIALALVLFLTTIAIVLKLYDEQFDLIPFE